MYFTAVRRDFSHKRHERGTTGDSQFKGTKGVHGDSSFKGEQCVGAMPPCSPEVSGQSPPRPTPFGET